MDDARWDDEDQAHGSCPICRRRDPMAGRVCEPCRDWQPIALASIAEKCADLLDVLIPPLEPDDRTTVNGRPHHDPIAAAPHLTAGPVAGEAASPRVSGTKEPTTPLNLSIHDLLGPVIRDGGRTIDCTGDNWVPLMVDTKPRKIWVDNGWVRVGRRIMVPAGDQVGLVPVSQVVDQEVRAWSAAGAPGSRFRPVADVPVMVAWLTVRLPWAFERYEPIDVFTDVTRSVRGHLMSALGEFDPPDLPCVGVECQRCDKRMLFRTQDGSGDVECKNPDCSKIYNAETYAEWSRRLGLYERSRRTPEEVRDLLLGRVVPEVAGV